MLHNKYTKAGALPNKFTDYVSSAYFFLQNIEKPRLVSHFAQVNLQKLLKNMEIRFV